MTVFYIYDLDYVRWSNFYKTQLHIYITPKKSVSKTLSNTYFSTHYVMWW